MIYKKYGKLDIDVSAVGFGGMRFDLKKPKEENAKLVLYAFDKGINYFDTAPFYCDDTSEDIFGEAFRQIANKRDKFYVSTKKMPTEQDTIDDTCKAVEKSLKRLCVDKIDFFHVWCIRTIAQYEMATKPGGLFDGLLKCKEQGLIGHIAVSTHLQGDGVKEIIERGKFEGVLLGVNILNFPFRWSGVQAAYDAGCGVVAMNPLAGGLIPQNEDKLSFLAKGSSSPTEEALRFCISCPQITVTLNGFEAREQIDMACRVADRSKPFSDVEIDGVKKHLSENMDVVCTGCGYCIGSCPKNIDVMAYMQVYNEKQLFNRTDDEVIKSLGDHHKYHLLVDKEACAADCVFCGRCEQVCTQHINIISRLEELAGWEKTSKEQKEKD